MIQIKEQFRAKLRRSGACSIITVPCHLLEFKGLVQGQDYFFIISDKMVEDDVTKRAIGTDDKLHGKLTVKFSPTGDRRILISFGCYRDYIMFNSFRYGDAIKNVADIPEDRQDYRVLF